MSKGITVIPESTIGLDVSDKHTHGFVVGADGEEVERFRCQTTAEGLQKVMAKYGDSQVVLEVGPHSPWMSRLLQSMELEVIVANPRRVRLIADSERKNDRLDAERLARLGRVDTRLLSPVRHRSEQAQKDLILLKARDGLVRGRTQLINQVRGFSKSLGVKLPKCSADSFARRMRTAVCEGVFPGWEMMLEMIQCLTSQIRRMDYRIERLCEERYPETEALRQVVGVGPITALAFVLTLEDPHRFERSRTVGAYLGLHPRQRESGERRPQLPITKTGDVYLRRLLVCSAHYVLGPFGPDTDLRRFGLRLMQRGGRAAKKRAVVAVARKLAMLLHRLWVSQETYVPVAYKRQPAEAA